MHFIEGDKYIPKNIWERICVISFSNGTNIYLINDKMIAV
jgi:hypothetical protein